MRAAIASLLLLAACGGGGGNGGADAYVPSCDPVEGTPALGLVEIASGFDMPVFVTSPPADHRLFVLEKTGAIRIVDGTTVLPEPFLTVPIPSDVGSLDDERGLLGLAFAPDYASSGKFYVFYVDPDGNETIDQYTVSADNPNLADATSQQQVFQNQDFAGNHNGGMLAFGPDGYLYFGIGDGGGGGDPMQYGQNTDVNFGKIMRVDVSSIPYTSPSDNPFVGGAGLDDIWLYGLRNPWRWSFDKDTGDLYIGDVGQDTWEEVDVVPHGQGGNNLGWSEREGQNCFPPGSSGCLDTGVTDPILEWQHGGGDPFGGNCVIGGYVYRGCSMPGYHGTYFFADYGAGWVRSLQWDGAGGYSNLQEWPSLEGNGIVSFGQDADGELYIVREDTGQIMRIVPQ